MAINDQRREEKDLQKIPSQDFKYSINYGSIPS